MLVYPSHSSKKEPKQPPVIEADSLTLLNNTD